MQLCMNNMYDFFLNNNNNVFLYLFGDLFVNLSNFEGYF